MQLDLLAWTAGPRRMREESEILDVRTWVKPREIRSSKKHAADQVTTVGARRQHQMRWPPLSPAVSFLLQMSPCD
jgi:hypothetical protein